MEVKGYIQIAGPQPMIRAVMSFNDSMPGVQNRGCRKLHVRYTKVHPRRVAYPGTLLGGGVQQIQLRTEDRENGDLGAVAP